MLGDFSFAKVKKSVSKGAKDLIKGILETNPRKRFTIKDIKNDKWFKIDYVDDIDKYLEEEKLLIDASEDDYTPISILSPDRRESKFIEAGTEDEGFTAIYK